MINNILKASLRLQEIGRIHRHLRISKFAPFFPNKKVFSLKIQLKQDKLLHGLPSMVTEEWLNVLYFSGTNFPLDPINSIIHVVEKEVNKFSQIHLIQYIIYK